MPAPNLIQRMPLIRHQLVLQRIRGYDMWFVAERINRDRLLPEHEVDSALFEFKNFIFLLAIGYSNLDMPIREIDIVWHTFLLFTSEYAEFCQKYIGFFVHHVPKTSRTHKDPSVVEGSFIDVYKDIFGAPPLFAHINSVDEAPCCTNCTSCRSLLSVAAL